MTTKPKLEEAQLEASQAKPIEELGEYVNDPNPPTRGNILKRLEFIELEPHSISPLYSPPKGAGNLDFGGQGVPPVDEAQ